MDADIFRDLKHLDERLQTVDHLLESCAELFEKHYSEFTDDNKETFSWPYAIEGTPAAVTKVKWGEYVEQFPDTPTLSPSTSALCGWAVSRLSALGSKAQKENRQKAASKAAEKLASLPSSRLKSKTWENIGEIFLHAQVLRLLASQNQFKGDLFEFVYNKVFETIKGLGNKSQHPFFLHYCVLAWEEVRDPALRVAECVLNICDLADDTAKLQLATDKNSLSCAISCLELAGGLREALTSFATIVIVKLQQPETGKRLDDLATKARDAISAKDSIMKKNYGWSRHAIVSRGNRR